VPSRSARNSRINMRRSRSTSKICTFSLQSPVCSFAQSARLAEILRHQATLLEHIVMDERYYAEYFRVAFYGNFPVALRNKQFVVRVEISLGFRFVVLSDLLTSTAASNGRNSVHSVNGCSTNTLEHSCSEPQATLLSISVLERINTSNVLPWLLNQTAPYRYSLTWTCRSLYGPITNTGLSHRFLLCG
jgi:hypothetical protein